MKTLLIATMLGSAAMTGSALAQAAAPDTTQSDPATQTPGTEARVGTEPMPQDGAQPGAEASVDGQMQNEGGFVTWQDGNQMIASNLMGADVWGAENESIGSVDDLLLDRDGQVVAVIVGVGGFLGVGQKDVAISNDQLTFVMAEDVAATGAAPAGQAAQDPAMAPAPQGTAAGGAMAPAPGETGVAGTTAPETTGSAAPGAGATGTAGTGMTGAPGTGMAGTGTATGWGWTGAGIDHIQVSYTREQLEAAPEFEAAE